MRDENLKTLFTYIGLVGAITCAGTYQPETSRRYGSESSAVRREFASMSWTDGKVWGHVHVQKGDFTPEGLAHLHYQVLREGDRKVLTHGRGYIRNGDLTWQGRDCLRLKTDTRTNPLLKRDGPAGVIDLRWDGIGNGPDAAEYSSSSARGKVFEYDPIEANTAVLENG